MLTISRKAGQQVRFLWGGKDIRIDVVSVGGQRVRLEVSAPDDMAVEMLAAKPRPEARPRPDNLPPRPAADSLSNLASPVDPPRAEPL